MTWQHPFPKNTITSPYGDKTPPRTSPHRGADYATGGNDVIRAVTDGKVTDIYWSNCLGWVSEQESASGKYRISYCHLNCYKHGANCPGLSAHRDGSNCMKNLKVGDRIEKGKTAVGRIGNTGTCSRGNHLHLVLGRKNRSAVSGYTLDPVKYIDKQIKKAAEASQKPEQTKPEVTTPDKAVNPPKSVLEALRVITAWFNK